MLVYGFYQEISITTIKKCYHKRKKRERGGGGSNKLPFAFKINRLLADRYRAMSSISIFETAVMYNSYENSLHQLRASVTFPLTVNYFTVRHLLNYIPTIEGYYGGIFEFLYFSFCK